MIPSRHPSLRRILTFLFATAVVIAAAISAQAKYGRDFAGHYEIKDVTDLGESVRITLAVRLVNYSGADVTSATVAVHDPLFMHRIFGTLSPSPLSVAKSRSVSLTGDITIPHREYDAWKSGTHPTLVLTQRGLDGKDHSSRIELAQRPLSEVQ
jgi:hypothetical protein